MCIWLWQALEFCYPCNTHVGEYFNKITETYENEEMNQMAELSIFGYEMRLEFVHTPAALLLPCYTNTYTFAHNNSGG